METRAIEAEKREERLNDEVTRLKFELTLCCGRARRLQHMLNDTSDLEVRQKLSDKETIQSAIIPTPLTLPIPESTLAATATQEKVLHESYDIAVNIHLLYHGTIITCFIIYISFYLAYRS